MHRFLPALAAAALFAVLSTGCAASRGVPRPYPGRVPGVPVERPAPPGTAIGVSAAEVARSLLGVRYRNGGSDPAGFDCSGLVQYAYAQAGLALPRSVREQVQAGLPVEAAAVEPGDLVFFAIDGRTVSHVGLVVGEDRFVHAPSARGVVREERLGAEYWRRRFSGARRVSWQ